MLQRLLEQEKPVCQVLGTDPKTAHLKLRWQDTEVMEAVVAALGPVADFTDILSAEKRVTASCLRPLLNHLCTEALVEAEGDTTLKIDIQNKIKQYMNEKYEDESTREMINLASCLDPRFMMNYFSEDEIAVVQHKIVNEGKLVARRMDESAAVVDITTEEATVTLETPINKKRKLVDILSKVSTSRSQCVNNEERTQDELARYLQMPSPDMKSNPLDWWKVHQTQFPILSTLAKKYLSVCATSCASERVFSAGGNIVTPYRSCLKPDKVDKLVFLAQNL